MTLDDLIQTLTGIRDRFNWPDGSPEVSAYIFTANELPIVEGEVFGFHHTHSEVCLRVKQAPHWG